MARSVQLLQDLRRSRLYTTLSTCHGLDDLLNCDVMRRGKTRKEVIYYRNCLQCGRRFRCARRHAKFCGSTCRKAYNRAHPAFPLFRLAGPA